MVTKATIQMQGVMSWERIENTGIHAPRIEDAAKELKNLADELEKCSRVISAINANPHFGIQNIIGGIFGRSATMKPYTKKRRTYSISYLTITEED